MSTTGKPKPAKLYKSKGEKKQKSQKKVQLNESNTDIDNNFPSKADSHVDSNSPEKVSKKRKKSVSFASNKKSKHNKEGRVNDSSADQNDSHVDQQSKSNTFTKKKKPENMTRKDWKMLHLDKKLKETVHPEAFMKKNGWRELHKKQKGKSDIYELGITLKKIWEELRIKNIQPERKNQLLKQVCDKLKGRVKEFSYAHDTVRVLESILAVGAEDHRTLLFEELKGDIIPLAKSKYGKFFVQKMLKYGSKLQKETIMKAFHGKVISLIRHSEAASVIEIAFNECANAQQRFELIQEFFGPSFKFFKVTNVHSLTEYIEANPDQKATIIENMKTELSKVLEKSVIKHSFVHHVLWQFFKHCDAASRSEIIESLRNAVPEILHTKDGSRVGMHCVWYGTTKDRKVIVKSMKMFVNKVAVEEHGHMVLLAIFDSVDDTLLVDKYIIEELKKNLLEISQNVHGKKVLIYLLSPRDPHFCHPDIINILKTGDGNQTSKKDPEIRRSELKQIIAEPLLQLIQSNIKELYTDNPFCLFTCTILENTVGDKKETFESIAGLLAEPYTGEQNNTHPVEYTGSSFMFKQLITNDQKTPEADCYFSEILMSTLPEGVLSSWIECNRGAFLLVNLIETGFPNVQKRIKEELEGKNKYLAKKKFRGAEILLKKLKESCK